MTVDTAPTAPAATPRPGPDDIEPVRHETRDRIITGTITVVPFFALALGVWQAWNSLLHWHDVAVFVILYLSTGFGITVGFHRLFTHRSFKAKRGARVTLAAFGSMAIEGNIISWVADHRKHHAFSDVEGDPHSPHVDHGVGWRGALRGLWHAHWGWLFEHTQRGKRERYAPDLLKDPDIAFIDRTFIWWAIGGIVVAFPLGMLLGGGSVEAGLTGLLWGGFIRILVLHHMTYSINSLCHFFGRRRFETEDHSRNLLWLSVPTMGESWHNNHHAFPTSAFHGLRWWLDPSALVIRTMEKLGLVWDVVRIDPDRQQRKASG